MRRTIAATAGLDGPQDGARRRAVDGLVASLRPTTGEDVEALLAALGGRVGHAIFVSTGRVHDHAQPMPLAEDAPRNLYWGDYARLKIAGEDAYMRSGVPASIVRPTHVYGPLNTRNNETFFFDRLLRGRPILVPGDGAGGGSSATSRISPTPWRRSWATAGPSVRRTTSPSRDRHPGPESSTSSRTSSSAPRGSSTSPRPPSARTSRTTPTPHTTAKLRRGLGSRRATPSPPAWPDVRVVSDARAGPSRGRFRRGGRASAARA